MRPKTSRAPDCTARKARVEALRPHQTDQEAHACLEFCRYLGSLYRREARIAIVCDDWAMSLVAGMLAGADSIDDVGVLRHGAMAKAFAGVRAPSTLGSFLRAFTRGTCAHCSPQHGCSRATWPRTAPRCPPRRPARPRSRSRRPRHRDGHPVITRTYQQKSTRWSQAEIRLMTNARRRSRVGTGPTARHRTVRGRGHSGRGDRQGGAPAASGTCAPTP